MGNGKLKIENGKPNWPAGRTTSYPCINHEDRDAWVMVGSTMYCQECYRVLRKPEKS
jgi:hypothetical protein